MPVSEAVPVQYDYHRYIIGKKGAGVRQLMEKYNVHISVPRQDDSADYITVIGPQDKVAACAAALREQVARLDDEKEDRVRTLLLPNTVMFFSYLLPLRIE